MPLSLLDYFVIAAYAGVIAGITWFCGRQRATTADDYFVAGRSMPGWAVAMAMMAALISSNTMVGHPATAYQKGLILLLGSLTLPAVLFFVAKVIVPFYRRTIRMSAYEYLGRRFGLGGRLYASICFMADRLFDVGVTLLTSAVPVAVMTGWPLFNVVAGLAVFTVAYTMLGGMRTIVWTSVVQGGVFMIAAVLIALRLLLAPECGEPGAVLRAAWEGGRLGLGDFSFSWASLFDSTHTTQWLLVLAYTVNWGRRYIADQHMVQRYLIARSDADAERGALWNGLLCVPVWAIFMLIGASLFGFYQLSGATPPNVADEVVPHFIVHQLPAGIVGLMLAAILAASMSSISPDLNSIATAFTSDIMGHFLPQLSDRARVRIGRLAVFVGGGVALLTALLMAPKGEAATIMERAVTVAAILSGGMLGLFFLGFFTRTATRAGCYAGLAACAVFTAWGTVTAGAEPLIDLGFNFPLNPILIGILGHGVVFGVGYGVSRLVGGHVPPDVDQLVYRRAPRPVA
ncbi:sodium:solute symporter family transporter [Actomonas aquatica]|uniref:Sodium/solute symporter n=1 Tax=Actomonas aquatica TaxID=2866162 RepID=A0ABZ1C9F4_9BACT|nr:sodium/solute symporter [Opitutus sp. WL0086]WRQ88270.1 sodium/solute symporter [Opitutus sp. WL0086]